VNEEWSLKDLTVAIPIVASSFAFAFVVGYFFAFDIAWFPFFSLSEHVVFALRALPIAIGASVGFLIALKLETLPNYWKWLQWLWICVLLAAGVLAAAGNHLGLAGSFGLVAVGAFMHNKMPVSQVSSVLYLATTAMVLSFIAGFVSGSTWKIDSFFRLPLARSIVVNLKAGNSQIHHVGHVIFVGSSGVLFYEYGTHTVHLFRSDNIQDILECPNNDC
jgi:hypothetical protein